MVNKDVVRVGVIGAGFARMTQIPAFRASEGARVVAIASARRENAEQVAREFDIPHVADGWRGVIARDDVDLVSIVTPPVTHMEMTLAALDAGKSVLCEKPMAMNAGEAKAMLQRANEVGVFAHIDHELRFLPGRRKMREMIGSGAIGHVRHAKFLWRAESRATPERAWDWWSDEAAGGGALGAIGSHAVDTFRWLLNARVIAVSATLATHVAERPDKASGEMRRVTTDDEANLLLEISVYGEHTVYDATGTISLSVVEPGRPEHCVEIFGTHGALRIEESGDLWHAPLGAGEWQAVSVEHGDLAAGIRDSGWGRGFTLFAREIVTALREGRKQVDGAATFRDGYLTQLVLDAARHSHQTGFRVRIS